MADVAKRPDGFIYLVYSESPWPKCQFVEAENSRGEGINVGTWVYEEKNGWLLKIPDFKAELETATMQIEDERALADEKYRELESQLAEVEKDNAQWKHCYDMRGKALRAPCLNCGYVPGIVRTQEPKLEEVCENCFTGAHGPCHGEDVECPCRVEER